MAYKKVDDLNTSMATYESQINTLRTDYEQQCRLLDDLRASLIEQKTASETLTNARLAELEVESRIKDEALLKLQQEFEESQTTISTLNGQTSSLTAQLSQGKKLEAEIIGLRSNLSDTQSNLVRAQDLEQSLLTKIRELETSQSSLQQSLYDSKQAQESAQQTIARLQELGKDQTLKIQETLNELESRTIQLADLQQLYQSQSEDMQRDEILADSNAYQLERRLNDAERNLIETEETRKQLQRYCNTIGEAFAQMSRDHCEYNLRHLYKQPDFLILRLLALKDSCITKRDEVLSPEDAKHILIEAEDFALQDFEFFIGLEHKQVAPIDKNIEFLRKAWFSRQMLWIVHSTVLPQLNRADDRQWTNIDDLMLHGFVVGPNSRIEYSELEIPSEKTISINHKALSKRTSKHLGDNGPRIGNKREVLSNSRDPPLMITRENIRKARKRRNAALEGKILQEIDSSSTEGLMNIDG